MGLDCGHKPLGNERRTEVQKLWPEEVHARAVVFDENEGPVGAELRKEWQPSLRVAQSVEPRGLGHVIGAGGGEPSGTIKAVEKTLPPVIKPGVLMNSTRPMIPEHDGAELR